MRVAIARLSLSLVLATAHQAGAPIKATISNTCAPWDGSAFMIAVPAHGLAGASDSAVIRISIWQAPNLKDSVSFRFPDRDGKTGNAYYAVGKNMPVELGGRVTFQRVMASAPVRGDFDLVSPAGVRYRAAFEASWTQVHALCG